MVTTPSGSDGLIAVFPAWLLGSHNFPHIGVPCNPCYRTPADWMISLFFKSTTEGDSPIKAHPSYFPCRKMFLIILILFPLGDARADITVSSQGRQIDETQGQESREYSTSQGPGHAGPMTVEGLYERRFRIPGMRNENNDQSVTDRVRSIAEGLAEDDEESIRDAFVHSPEELDDLTAPVEFREAVDHYIAYFTIKKRKMFASWLRRSQRYAPLFKKILRDHDLPEDLVYLAMIESGFNPRAYSPMNACGPWQFISATGQRYGLRIDHWVDERQDFEKATVAAARYLRDLFGRFNCWYLAASGYNAGEGRIERAIRRFNTSDYWELYQYNTLPRETREYLPQLIAAATISENPERYGFADTDPSEPFQFCTREVPGGTPLRLLAEASSSDVSTIRALNPELMTGITPPGKSRYSVRLPAGTSLERFDRALRSRLPGKRVVDTIQLSRHRQRSLSRLLKRYGATKKDLDLVNRSTRPRAHRLVYIPLFQKPSKAKGAARVRKTVNAAVKPAAYQRLKKNANGKALVRKGRNERTVFRKGKARAACPASRKKKPSTHRPKHRGERAPCTFGRTANR